MGSHIEGGLGSLIYFLERECIRNGVQFHFNTPVHKIEWRRGSVHVQAGSKEFEATLCVITIPPSVLKTGRVRFVPDIAEHMDAINKIETGGVIKFLFEFKEMFWDSKSEKKLRQFPDMHFVFSDAYVPTWWSQLPSSQPLLTGWLSGPLVKKITKSDAELMRDGVTSLANIFDASADEISSRLRSSRVVNWETDPWSRGAYAYRTVNVQSALEFLSTGVQHTIFFAGEGFSAGKEIGTVEAALQSGKKVAEKMLQLSGTKLT